MVAFVGVEATPADQRDDWRGVATAIGPARLGVRVVVVDPSDGAPALRLYLSLRRVPPSTARLTFRELDVIDVAHSAPLPSANAGIPGYTPQPVVHTTTYTLARYVATTPRSESYAQIAAVALVSGASHNGGPSVLVEP